MSAPLLQVAGLAKHFPQGGGWLRPPQRWLRALDGVTFTLAAGEVLAVVGESGSGKTTLAQTIAGLEPPTAGQVLFRGRDMTRASAADLQAMRREVQLLFQDPYESLNPRMTVAQIVAEPLVIHRQAPAAAHRDRAVAALEAAGLRPATAFLARRPHELSGGQRQRVAIAAALVLEPALILADEPVSMLDVSVRAEIINLFADLRAARNISMLLITHDLSTVAMIADRIAVMYLGRIVELGPAAEVVARPQHPYTQALLAAVPTADPRLRKRRAHLAGETPHPAHIPTGCRFHPRCPQSMPVCAEVDPPTVAITPHHCAACLLYPQPEAAPG